MPLAPPVAMSQNATANPLMLTMDGFDLMRVPGTTPPTYGVPLDSIELVEASPGAVSTLKFTVNDPNNVVPLPQNGSQIVFWDLVRDVPLFRGTVNTWQILPYGVGRDIALNCDGPETVLDTIVVAGNLAAGQAIQDAIINVASVALFGVTISPSGSQNGNGPGAGGVGLLGCASIHPTADYAVSLTGVSFREAVRQFVAATSAPGCTINFAPWNKTANLTVDMYGGLRLFNKDTGEQPLDWTTLTVSDTAAGAIAAMNLNYEVHPADIVRELYITGGGGLSSWFGDGSGIRGRQASFSDGTLDTAVKLQAAAAAYFQAQAANVRGSFDIDAFLPTATVHAGGILNLTDNNAGVTNFYVLGNITKTFAGGTVGLQRWHVEFGGRAPSAMRQLRSLTRGTLS